MSFIEFESGWDKEKARQELREVRAELLKRVKYKIYEIFQWQDYQSTVNRISSKT